MKHLSFKKLLLQFFIVGGYMGYHISNGFGFGITQTDDQTISIIDTNTGSQNEQTEQTQVYIQFENNIDQYIDNFSQEDEDVIDFFVGQSIKAQQRSGYDQNFLYKINQLLVILHKEFGLTEVTTSLKELNQSQQKSIRKNHYKVSLKTQNIKEVLAKMKQSPLIKHIEPVPILSITSSKTQRENENWYREKIESNKTVIPNPTQKREVTIAVIDNAINTEHPMLKSYISEQYDVADNDQDTTAPQDTPSRNHGTHIAGTIVQTNKMILPDTKINIIPIKIAPDNSDGTRLTHIVEGIEQAIIAGANIINMSFAGCLPHQYTFTLHEIIKKNPEIVFVAAAGNQNNNPLLDRCEHELLGTLETGTYGWYPAAVDTTNMIAVSATNQNDSKLENANYGSYIDLYAPGKSILSSVGQKRYEKRDGTSSAGSIVAGAASILFSIQEYTPSAREIKNKLIDSSTTQKQTNLTAGRINLCKMVNNVNEYKCNTEENKNTITICNQNNICESEKGENNANCSQDCNINSCNQNNICESHESIKYCSHDCGCDFDQVCDVLRAENSEDCPYDCPKQSVGQEICNDQIDNDNDGKTDCFDSDCINHISCFATTASTGNTNTGAICANGILEGDEACDDGNTTNKDGCSSTCKQETPSCKLNIKLGEGSNANKATLVNLGYTDQSRINVKKINRGEGNNHATNVDVPISNTYQSAGSYTVKATLENKNDDSKSIECTQSIQIQSIQGCTDPNANNHDPEATTNDGSCRYGNRNTFSCEQLNIKKIADESNQDQFTMNFKRSITQNIESVSLYPGEGDLYNNVTSPLSHTYEQGGQYNAKFIVKANSGLLYNCHTTVNIGKEGCTYPEADNYNPEAAIDDGTCVISPGEGFVNILTRIPYRNQAIHGHVQYSHTPELIDVNVQILQNQNIIKEFFPELSYDGTFSIPLQSQNNGKSNYIAPGNYTLLYTIEHRKGGYSDSKSYDIIIE